MEKEKKEIGIEKLIELLNEYEKELNTGLNWRIDEKYGMLWRGLNLMGVDQYLISKHYGFIKWLVENDKIDFENMEGHGRLIGYLTDNMEKPTRDKVKEELVIMLLSISDTPIEDLISYLK